MSLAVIGTNEYPNFMKNRRSDQSIRQYLPFNEFNNVNNISKATNKKLIKSLKIHSIISKEFFFILLTKLFFYLNRDAMSSTTYSQ